MFFVPLLPPDTQNKADNGDVIYVKIFHTNGSLICASSFVLEKNYLIHRDIVLVVGVDLRVLLGRKTGVMLEIVDEMGLVVKTALERDLTPIDGWISINGQDRFLKPHDPEIGLRRYANVLSKHGREMLWRVTDL